MSVGLHAAARDYLSEHHARGYRLDDHERLLGAFLGPEACVAVRITVVAALASAIAKPRRNVTGRSAPLTGTNLAGIGRDGETASLELTEPHR